MKRTAKSCVIVPATITMASLLADRRASTVTLSTGGIQGKRHGMEHITRHGTYLADSMNERLLLLFQTNMCLLVRVEHLCLISGVALRRDVVDMHVTALVGALPRLRCFHAHYRDIQEGSEKRITWMRKSEADKEGVLVRDGPCVLCSTATFIGLAKPRNRSFTMV